MFLNSEWRSVDREVIKKAVRNYKIRLVVATDAACEGLNLQTLATLINVDLPWNPSRLEQRIGRIKRYGQKKDRVKMANLVYQGTVDERVYDRLSERMKDRYDLLGSLPDVTRMIGSKISKSSRRHSRTIRSGRRSRPTCLNSDTGTSSIRMAPNGNSARRCSIKTKHSGFLAMAGKSQLST